MKNNVSIIILKWSPGQICLGDTGMTVSLQHNNSGLLSIFNSWINAKHWKSCRSLTFNQVSGGGRCSIWHTWGTRWADMLLHPHQTRPKNRARYPHPLDRPVSTATCRAYFFFIAGNRRRFFGHNLCRGPNSCTLFFHHVLL